MTFESPAHISTPSEVQDFLVFHVKEEGLNFFYSMQNKRLDPEKHTVKRKIRRQMENTALNRGLEDSAEGGELSLKFLLIFTFLMNLVLQGSMIYFTMMIRSMQLILHMPILKVLVPSNVSMIFGYIIPVVMFDIFDTSWTTEVVLEFDEDEQLEL